MKIDDILSPTPWDQKIFKFPTYEVLSHSKESLEKIRLLPGHFTVKLKPEDSPLDLQSYGFYYCDTLIHPFCKKGRLLELRHPDVALSHSVNEEKLRYLSEISFTHGRFHRDHNISTSLADLRYSQWFAQLAQAQTVFSFLFQGEVVGFFGYTNGRILLHALDEKIRGKGLAKYFWSLACSELFKHGHEEIESSVSADNMPVLNLYVSLGFRFRNPIHCYHRFIPQKVPS